MAAGKYRTIVADPPWPYPEGFTRNTTGRYADGTSATERTPLPYRSLTLEQIRGIGVSTIAADDSWLFLWATNRWLREAFDVADAWGFLYRQTVVWHKNDGHPRLPAVVAPNRAEYLLVCKKGKPERGNTWPSNVIEIPFNPARLAHSQKPEAFLDLIEAVAPGPYLEMFARRQRLGWDTWGDEALDHLDVGLSGLPREGVA